MAASLMSNYRVNLIEEKEISGDEKVDTKEYSISIEESASASVKARLVKSTLLLVFTKRKIGKNRYRVLLEQQKDSKKHFFYFYKGTEYTPTKSAFTRLDSVLGPFCVSGMVLFTKELLNEIILPEPKSIHAVGPHLVDVMEKTPGTHPEWMEIIQALLTAVDPDSASGVPSPLEAKMEFFKNKFKELPKSHPVQKKANVGARVLVNPSPFVAVPQAQSEVYITDDEDSERVWTNFRRGTLSKFDTESNDKCKTWLISAVEKQYLKSSVKLTLSGIGVGDKDHVTGDTALHIAVRRGNLTLVKLLLAYRADPTALNNAEQTPISISETLTSRNASDIRAVLKEIQALDEQVSAYNSANSTVPEKKNSSDAFLLSLDGGGMKSVIMCRVLAAIDSRMKQLCGDSCVPLQNHFDYIAGTSAGAIVSGLLLYTETSVQLAGMYLYKFMVDVFGCSTTDRTNKLKGFLVDALGEETTLSQLDRGNIIVMATIANVSPNKLHIMSNYGDARDEKPGPEQRKVWEALIASSAAPTYFPAFESFLDGGLMANNPTLAAMNDIYQRAKKESKPVKIGCVVSLGTGYVRPTPVENFDVFVPGFTIDIAKKLFNSSMGLVSLLSHFADQTTQSNGECVSQARTWCESIGAEYFRLSPPMEELVAPDMCDIEKLISLMYDTQVYVLQQHEEIDRIAKTILSK